MDDQKLLPYAVSIIGVLIILILNYLWISNLREGIRDLNTETIRISGFAKCIAYEKFSNLSNLGRLALEKECRDLVQEDQKLLNDFLNK